jgi:hypothetical protein
MSSHHFGLAFPQKAAVVVKALFALLWLANFVVAQTTISDSETPKPKSTPDSIKIGNVTFSGFGGVTGGHGQGFVDPESGARSSALFLYFELLQRF